MSGYCVTGEHENCPDTIEDSYACSCPCHIEGLDYPQILQDWADTDR